MANVEKWKKRYEEGTSGAGSRLVEGYVEKTGKLAAATSDSAQKSYEEAMKDPKVLKRRQNKLKKLSEDDLNKAMEAKGSTAYTTGTAAAVDKAAQNVSDFLNKQEEIVKSLPPRTRDVKSNVLNRVVPLAEGMSKLKESKA